MAGLLKKSTGLTGLKVSSNPHYTLTAIYGKILRCLAKMPQEASYRKNTELIINDRLKAVQTHKGVKELENAVNCGQAEELILQAEKELVLARRMLGWKAWEPLARQAPATQWQWPPAERKAIGHE